MYIYMYICSNTLTYEIYLVFFFGFRKSEEGGAPGTGARGLRDRRDQLNCDDDSTLILPPDEHELS